MSALNDNDFMTTSRTCAKCGSSVGTPGLENMCLNCLLESTVENEIEDEADLLRTEGALTQELGGRFGDYELLEEVGRGGMGIVYRARQMSLKRIVALKVLPFGPMAKPEFVQRFIAEASAGASLHHPNIVTIFEVGVHNGQHFFSMDFVEGPTLARVIGEIPLNPRRAATYLKTIAEAIHYAHERGILHRDLKPSNILIDLVDQPRVTDFGLAKRLDASVDLTLSGQLIGSPNYMSPEQAAGGRLGGRESSRGRGPRVAVGRASDVYSLGGVLYHCLAGRPPFLGETLAETVHQVIHSDAPALRALNAGLPTDLETICAKCLEKDPARRYPNAGELAAELGRFLANEPIRARPVTLWENLWRWRQRKPLLAALSAAIVFLLLAFVIGGPIALYRINHQKRLAQAEASARRLQLYAAEVNLAGQALEQWDINRARALLRKQVPLPGQTNDLRGFEWRYLYDQCRGNELATLGGQDHAMLTVRFSPDGALLAAQESSGMVKVWELPTRTLVASFGESGHRSTEIFESKSTLAFSPDGRSLAAGVGPKILIWQVESRQTEVVLTNAVQVNFLLFLRDGKVLASAGDDGSVSLWDVQTTPAKLRGSLRTGFGHAYRLACSPDGKILAASGADTAIVRWDISDLQKIVPVATLDEHAGWIATLAYAPQTNLLYSTGADGDVIAWNFAADAAPPGWRRLPHPHGSMSIVFDLALAPDGQHLISGGSDQNVTVWDLSGHQEPIPLKGHSGVILSVAISPDGQTIASGGMDKTVKLWSFPSPLKKPNASRLMQHGGFIQGVAFSPDSKLIASSTGGRRIHGSRNGIKLWNAAALELRSDRALPGWPGSRLNFSADGKILATEDQGTIRLRQIPSLDEMTSFPGTCPVFAASGNELVYFSDQTGARGLHWLNTETNSRRIWTNDWLAVKALSLSRDGRRVAAVVGNRVLLWSADFSQGAREIGKHLNFMSALAFSPCGQTLASAGWDGAVRLWNLEKPGNLIPPLLAHNGLVWTAVFSPDGRTLATGGDDACVKLWNLASLQEAAVLRGHSGPVTGLAFSPDGTSLASSGGDGTLRLWKAPALAEIDSAANLQTKNENLLK